jgi:hypothetical protein
MKAITTDQFSNLGTRYPSECFPNGKYRITPTLKGMWSRPNPVAVVLLGSRTIEPQSASVVLKKDNHIQSVEFELVRRPRPWGQS